jgi:hypothetical protein
MTIALQVHLTGGKSGAGLSSLHTTLQELASEPAPCYARRGRIEPPRFSFQLSKLMQDGWKVYMDSYMASNRSYFMVTWTIFKSNLLEVGLTQNRETMALQNITTVDLFYYILGNLSSTVAYCPKYNICIYSSFAVLALLWV